ncbi:MAG: hypothetical protein ABSG91_20745 [Syntrophobacteraceae bacterium]|jgi:hypothetical protein
MTIDEYLKSFKYHLFLDELLRENACRAVDQYLDDHERRIEKAQIHSIPAVITAGGLNALKVLAEKQTEKNTKPENKEFWDFLLTLIIEKPGRPNPDFSLYSSAQKEVNDARFLRDEATSPGKVEGRQVRKANREIISRLVEAALATYFEHFNCHYFYRTRHGVGR